MFVRRWFGLGYEQDAQLSQRDRAAECVIVFARGPVDPKFQVKVVAPTNHSSQKTRLNDLSCGIKIWTDLSSVLPQSTRLTDGQTDRRTDGRTELSLLDRVCIACSALKMDP